MLKIFVFSWNTQSVILESTRFIEKLKETINHDILIFGLQEDAIRTPIIFTELKKEFTDYEVVQETELSGWGVTTYKSMKNNLEYRPRGLRLIVFKKGELKITSNVSSYVFPTLKNKITWGKGVVIINLDIENYGKLTIANLHLPYNSESLKKEEKREKALKWQTKCFEMAESIINGFSPDYTIVMGDLNFRVTGLDSVEVCKKIKNNDFCFKINDELSKTGILDRFNEGVNNEGPNFPPTCKLFQMRSYYPDEMIYNIGKFKQRTPSWCDRILYKNLECESYKRYDEFEIRLSDHASVISEFYLDLK